MDYVDGFLLAVPRKRLKEYQRIARLAAKVWCKHGALDYKECVQDDMPAGFYPFPKAAKVKPGEVVVFSYIRYKSKSHRNTVNAKVMKDPKMQSMGDIKDMPFDMKRMAYGGFKVLVSG